MYGRYIFYYLKYHLFDFHIGKHKRGESYYIPEEILQKILSRNEKNVKLSIKHNINNNIVLPKKNNKKRGGKCLL